MLTLKDMPTTGCYLITAFEEDLGYVYTEEGERTPKSIDERRFLVFLHSGIGDGVKNTFQRWWISAHIHGNPLCRVEKIEAPEIEEFINSAPKDQQKYLRESFQRMQQNDLFKDIGNF